MVHNVDGDISAVILAVLPLGDNGEGFVIQKGFAIQRQRNRLKGFGVYVGFCMINHRCKKDWQHIEQEDGNENNQQYLGKSAGFCFFLFFPVGRGTVEGVFIGNRPAGGIVNTQGLALVDVEVVGNLFREAFVGAVPALLPIEGCAAAGADIFGHGIASFLFDHYSREKRARQCIDR